MSLNLMPSYSPVGHPGLVVDNDWWKKAVGKKSDFFLEYTHTARKTPVIVDCSGSTKASASLLKTDRDLLRETRDDAGNAAYTFAGPELFWNNQWRIKVIKEGLDKFVPQVLYLVRPETAYTSCLHFLAKELGGMKTHRDQRSFILRNPGLQDLMGHFWARFQKT